MLRLVFFSPLSSSFFFLEGSVTVNRSEFNANVKYVFFPHHISFDIDLHRHNEQSVGF